MSSRRSRPRSIAAQLVALFALAAAVLLCCGLGVLYWIVVRHAVEEDNEALADKLVELRAELDQAGGPELLAHEITTARIGERVGYAVRVLDLRGATLLETPGMDSLLPRASFPPNDARPTPRAWRASGKSFALISTRDEVNGHAFIIQLAQDRSIDQEFRKQFGALVTVVMLVGTLVAAAIALLIARRGLRPLTEMKAALQKIGPHHLEERVTATAWPAELQPLAAAFDAMLSRLEESFTRLSQFSADIAHELRTPIGNIRGAAEVMLTRARTAEEYCETLESAAAECERLSTVIDRLLFLARADAAEERISRTCFDARAVLEKLAAYYAPLAQECEVTIDCEGAGEIYADAVLFGRAVSNLIDNALRFTPAGGTIRLTIVAEITRTKISVADTGSGIAPEHLPRVFDRLYRADASRSSRGAGLGLALVKSIAELHGGTATITSAPGAGTTVTLTFPLA